MTKTAIVTWTLFAAALAGVVVFALYARRGAESGETAPSVARDEELGGVAPEKTSELLSSAADSIGADPCVDESGRALNTADLRGKFVVANFIFTTCSGICPPMSSRMESLQSAMKDVVDLRLVSFTVDPEKDTPAVLAEYARRYHADPARWTFLRCEKPALQDIAYDRMHVVHSRDTPVLHASKFVLLDKAGRLRAYYSPLDDDKWIEKLRGDLEKLRAEKPE
jgi:protein SCO1